MSLSHRQVISLLVALAMLLSSPVWCFCGMQAEMDCTCTETGSCHGEALPEATIATVEHHADYRADPAVVHNESSTQSCHHECDCQHSDRFFSSDRVTISDSIYQTGLLPWSTPAVLNSCFAFLTAPFEHRAAPCTRVSSASLRAGQTLLAAHCLLLI